MPGKGCSVDAKGKYHLIFFFFLYEMVTDKSNRDSLEGWIVPILALDSLPVVINYSA